MLCIDHGESTPEMVGPLLDLTEGPPFQHGPQLATFCLSPKHRPTLSTCRNTGVDNAACLLGAIDSERKRYGRLVAGHADRSGVHCRSHTSRVPRPGVGGRDV